MPTSPASTPTTHKFGGTSVADAACMQRVVDILMARDEAAQVVVVSAMKGTTDALIALGESASRGEDTTAGLAAIALRHAEASKALFGPNAKPVDVWLEAQFASLKGVLHTLSLLGGTASDGLLYVQGLGEVFSARLVTEAFIARGAPAVMLDAREVLVVRHEELGVAVDWDESQKRFDAWRAAHPSTRIVATGFVARDASGRVTTLGRNGSDFSGAIFGALAKSPEIHIWTDVDGVLSADPRLVPEAELLSTMSYDEACELAYFGARVIHPQTMAPAIARDIPLRIRNTFKPEHEGTVISSAASTVPPVKGLTTFSDQAIVNVEGAGMIGVPGTAERVFGALHRAGISVAMISQGSSEHSICCVLAASRATDAVRVLTQAFRVELDRGHIQRIAATLDITVLAAVGDGMAGTTGIAGRLFEALGRSQINVRAIAQGSSERNISVAVESKDATRALRAVHSGFYLSAQTLSVGVVGAGQVGQALIAQLAAAKERLKRDANIDLRVRAIATSKRMLLDDKALALDGWQQRMDDAPPTDLDRLAAHVRAPHLPHAILIDCSASSAVADRYAGWLAQGIHVITPNKQAGSGPLQRYEAIRQEMSRGARFRGEATVGAGLPIITTLRDLLDTGDEVRAIEGMLSGTLAYLFNRYDGSAPFSALVKEAKDKGYTEPDPRDDLSGTDVARKIVILARELGWTLSLEDVEVESLVPTHLRDGDKGAFLTGLDALDAPMSARLDAARKEGKVLRYVARLEKGGAAKVGLLAVPQSHAFAHGQLTDNIVQFTTRRYNTNPLVVQGPGAGPDVTAAGVFADLLRVAVGLGAKL